MNLYYELLQYPVFSMKEVNALYSSERTARAALEKLLKENMVLKIRNKLYTCVSGENGGPVANKFQIASAITPSSYVSHHTAFLKRRTFSKVSRLNPYSWAFTSSSLLLYCGIFYLSILHLFNIFWVYQFPFT